MTTPPPRLPSTVPSLSPVTRPSTVDLITIELRNAIYSGALTVGSPLREADIARQLEVSRGPLREAAQRLVQEGLLVATPGRGLRVLRIGRDRIPSLYAARAVVECAAARLLVTARDERALEPVRRAFDALSDAESSADARRIGDADLNTHWALVAAAGNPWLTRYMTTLIVEVRVATFTVSEEYAVRRDSVASHRDIIDRLTAWDADGLEIAIRANLDAAVARLLHGDSDLDTVEESDEVVPRLGPIGVALDQ